MVILWCHMHWLLNIVRPISRGPWMWVTMPDAIFEHLMVLCQQSFPLLSHFRLFCAEDSAFGLEFTQFRPDPTLFTGGQVLLGYWWNSARVLKRAVNTMNCICNFYTFLGNWDEVFRQWCGCCDEKVCTCNNDYISRHGMNTNVTVIISPLSSGVLLNLEATRIPFKTPPLLSIQWSS